MRLQHTLVFEVGSRVAPQAFILVTCLVTVKVGLQQSSQDGGMRPVDIHKGIVDRYHKDLASILELLRVHVPRDVV